MSPILFAFAGAAACLFAALMYARHPPRPMIATPAFMIGLALILIGVMGLLYPEAPWWKWSWL